MQSIFGEIFREQKPKLKDRMRTVILRAKRGTRQQFIEELAKDYIRISKEL